MTTIHAPVLTSGHAGRVWIQSDLQLSNPDKARKVLTDAVDDILGLQLGIGAIWCLGDAVCGSKIEDIETVAQTTVEQFGRLGVPVCYVLGNHESDLKRTLNLDRYPLYELVKNNPSWHVSPSLDDLYFARMVYGTLVIFTSDHMASDKTWWTTHGGVRDDQAGRYPYPPQTYNDLRDAIARHDGPVITASHYAYPGGQRQSELMRALLPLPDNVKFHCYGHAHIGDLVWNKEKPYLRPNPIEGQSLIQFNISALETARSAGSHSAILDIGPNGPEKLRIRCHLEKRWTETFTLPMHQQC